jgi:2-C-methyl-D-erythritol 4-phosphate cytidylyltransferase
VSAKIFPRTLTQKEYALIVAGGKGERFKSRTPKQFLELNGKPILLHTVEAFFRYSDSITVVLVLPEDEVNTWDQITKKYHFNRPLIIKSGGATRFHSVKKGLDALPDNGFVAIHDGVRPLVTRGIIESSFRLARVHQCAVASVRPKDSIRMDENHKTEGDAVRTVGVDRSRLHLIQTPQTFDIEVIKHAYAAQEDASLTDDASVAEKAGYPIFLFEGSYSNIKITTAEDLSIAAALLRPEAGM